MYNNNVYIWWIDPSHLQRGEGPRRAPAEGAGELLPVQRLELREAVRNVVGEGVDLGVCVGVDIVVGGGGGGSGVVVCGGPPRPLCVHEHTSCCLHVRPYHPVTYININTHLRRRVPHHEEVPEVQQPLQVAHARLQRVEVDEVERQVQLPQELAGAVCVYIWGQRSPATCNQLAMCFNEPPSLFMMHMHPPEPLHAREVVERDVQVLKLLEVVQVSEAVDHVVL